MRKEFNTFINSHTKEEIMAILDYFGRPFNRSMRKSELGKSLDLLLNEDPHFWLDKLMEADLKLMKKLCKAGPDVKMTLIRPDYPSVVEVLHLVDVWQLGDENMEISIGRPIFDLISPWIDEVIDRKESDGTFEIERLIFGCLNIYGVVPLRTFVDRLFDGENTDEEAMNLSSRISVNPLVRLYQEEYKGEYYIISPFVENFEEILEMRRMTFKDVRKYSKMTKQGAIGCGSFAPNCAYGLDTEEGQALIEMLGSLGYSGEDLEFQLHSVWMSSQYAIDEEATEILFRPVTSRQEGISSFKQFMECIQTIVSYSNIVPKWLLKGMSANDTGLMKLTVRAEDLEEEYIGPIDMSKYPEELEKFYNLGMIARPTDPFAPCPCGSGFSYCYCHGRKERLS